MRLSILFACACSGPAGPASIDSPVVDAELDAPATTCVFGDPSAPLQIEIVHHDERGQTVVTPPDAALLLQVPAQGIGEVVLIGARVTNVEGCHVQLVTSFHDVCDPAPLKVDSRPADLEDAGEGWAVTPLPSLSTLQICTSPTAKRLTQGQPFVFTVDVTDRANRHAMATVTATPTCPANDSFCICQCHPDFNFGACPPGPDPVPPAC